MVSDILEFLLEREQRIARINNLRQKYHSPCLFVRANYPGVNKCNEVTKGIVNEIIKKIYLNFDNDNIVFSEKGKGKEGPYGIFIIKGKGNDIKKRAINIEEEHFLGRLVDIDVYDIDRIESISRKDFNKEGRKCYLCNDFAHNCVRSRKHSIEDIKKYIENRWRTFNEQYVKDRL